MIKKIQDLYQSALAFRMGLPTLCTLQFSLRFLVFSLFFASFSFFFLDFFLLGAHGAPWGGLGALDFFARAPPPARARAKETAAPRVPHGAPWAPSKKKLRKKQENEAKNKEKTRKSKKNTGIHRLQSPWRAHVMSLGAYGFVRDLSSRLPVSAWSARDR